MKKISIGLVYFGVLLSIFINVYADIPNKTVVIGENAYTFEYAHDENNSLEIREAIKNSRGKILVKVNDKWFDNQGQIFEDYNTLPQIKLKYSNGVIKRYRKGDGELIIQKKQEIDKSILSSLKGFFLIVEDGKWEVAIGETKRFRIINPTHIDYEVKVSKNGLLEIVKGYNYLEITGEKEGVTNMTFKIKNKFRTTKVVVTE
ncbi:hypothetical protein [Oceanirhabdus seepicola]|uniref:Uncharacterized protein n=1 Tax=Oceanirhabdus seepicola TaxID=2828781 RepID=A0A9J6P2K4_9CLOT|nr:hypothetical protein [Oceanirhabdus seepicola]MCM1990831.1 hypothetical protein [Oceanirhabdus seepicola]